VNIHVDKNAVGRLPTAIVELHRRCTESNLKYPEMIVLAALVEGGALIDGEPNVALSRYEIADRTGLSWQQVQRAISSLQAQGWIGRRQNAKRSGEVAVTIVSARAYALFGIEGGAEIGLPGLPLELGNLLAGESAHVTRSIAEAWRNATLPDAEVIRQFRGANRVWVQVEFLLQGRIEAVMAERQLAFELAQEKEAEEQVGRFRLDLKDGTSVVFDRDVMTEATRDCAVAIRSADLRFARDVLEILDSRSPGAVSGKNADRLAAEILFSRHCGFVWRHDYSDACRILASVISKGGWKKPNRMDSTWYRVCRQAVRADNPQGVRLRVA